MWLKEGYTNKKIFDSDYEELLHFIKLTIGLRALEWYHIQKYKGMIDRIKLKLFQDINYFK